MKPSRIDILFDLILQVFPRKTIKLPKHKRYENEPQI